MLTCRNVFGCSTKRGITPGPGTFSRPRARHCRGGPKLPARGARDGDRLNAGDDRAARVRTLYPVRAWLRDGSEIVIRLDAPDAASEQAFMQALSAESRYFRFMSTLRELPAGHIAHRFTHPDFDREVALIALAGALPQRRQIGVARCIAKDAQLDAEFAVVIADDWQRRGVGKRLLCELMRAARAAGFNQLWGDVLASNQRMVALMRTLGFTISSAPEDAMLRRVVKNIDSESAAHKDLRHAKQYVFFASIAWSG